MDEETKRRKTARIFKLAAVINILINLDGGAVPASLNEIVQTFELTAVQTGLVGSLVYLGIATGSVLVSPILNVMSPLRATQATLILNTCATALFGASAGTGMLLVVRFFIGVLQAIPMVYFPVWVDEFGPEDARTVWMAVIQAGAPLGIMSGYVFAGFMTASMPGNPDIMWRISFFAQSGVLSFLSLLSFLIIPAELFNVGDGGAAATKEVVSPPFGTETVLEEGGLDEASKLPGLPNIKKQCSSGSKMPDVARLAAAGSSPGLGRIAGVSGSNSPRALGDSPPGGRGRTLSKVSSYLIDGLQPIQGRVMSESMSGHAYAPRMSKSGSSCSDEPRSPRGVRMSQAYRNRLESNASANGEPRLSMAPRVSVCTPMDLFRPSIAAPSGAWSPSLGASAPPSLPGQVARAGGAATPTPHTPLRDKYPVLQLLSSPIYMACVCTLTALFFVVTGIQFWVTEYMTDVIGQEKSIVVPTFGITSITAPLLGVFLGGCVTDKLGGYRGDVEMARTLKACFITGCLAALSAVCGAFIPAQMVDINDPTPSFITLTGFIALTLFFGGGLIPAATGVLVIAVSVELRELSSAGSMFFFQLFGYALSPLVSSIVMQIATFSDDYVTDRWQKTNPASYDDAFNASGLGLPNQTAIDDGIALYTKKLKLETGFTVCMLWAFFGVLAMFWAWRSAEAVVRRNKKSPMLGGSEGSSAKNGQVSSAM